jgi:hypothetical protein
MATLFPKSELLKVLSVLATIPACFLLFSGGYVLMRYAEIATFKGLGTYGVLPLLGGIVWLLLAAWLWGRAVEAKSLWDSLRVVALRAFAAIALACIAVLVAIKMRGH